ncbi:MAG: hypothetical protein ACI4MP_08505 [Candidatus Ventricola sp.]
MGTLTDSLFTVLMSWVRGLVNALWALFSSDHTTALEFLGKNWLLIAAVLIAAGLVIDWIIWLLRWQPYHLWAQRARRLLHMEEPEDEEEAPAKAHAAVMPQRRETAAQVPQPVGEDELPLYLGEEDEQMAMERAQSAPDEYAYPGMRYDSTAQEELGGTQRYGAVTQEGPGAAEVARRRAEIEAWQLQMQEEARARAEAERAAYEAEQARLAQEAYEAEQARLAQEAYEAEQARLAQEAYEAEQARLAQEQYERELAEYERQKAQYERELAEYERQKAAYDAQMAREAAAQQMQEQAGELAPAQGASRRRRSAKRSYSDYVEGEDVADLPDAPQWPQMPEAQPAPAAEPAQKKAGSRLLGRMAKMIEPEEEQLAARPKLPPRVSVQDAYRPAASPGKPDRRNPHV